MIIIVPAQNNKKMFYTQMCKYVFLQILFSSYHLAAPPPAAIDTNNVCPPPEHCHMHAQERMSFSLFKNVKYGKT